MNLFMITNFNCNKKFLVFTLTQILGWNSHTNYVPTRISKSIFILRILKHRLCLSNY